MIQRAVPLYCPFCGEEDLRPNPDAHGAWECHGCARVFTVRFTGLLASAIASAGQGSDPELAGSPVTTKGFQSHE